MHEGPRISGRPCARPAGSPHRVELIVCAEAIAHNVVPPTINYAHRDPACDLDFVPNEARPHPVDIALTNAFGFGGSNGTLAV